MSRVPVATVKYSHHIVTSRRKRLEESDEAMFIVDLGKFVSQGAKCAKRRIRPSVPA